jgi:hypothetical protein
MLRWLAAALGILALSLAALAVWWNWAPLHRGTDVRRAERLLATLPPPPLARERTRYVSPKEDQGSCSGAMGPTCLQPSRAVGYSLIVEYSMPRPMGVPEVLAWYRSHLHGWTESDTVPAPLLDFRRRNEDVQVDAQQDGIHRSFRVIVDPGA